MRFARISTLGVAAIVATGFVFAAAIVSRGSAGGPAVPSNVPVSNGNSGAFPGAGAVSYPVVLPDAQDHVGPIAIDRARQGLWFGSSGDGQDALNFFSFATRTLTSYALSTDPPTAFIRSGIAVAKDGSVWASFGSALARWDPTTRVATLVNIPVVPSQLVLNTPLPDELKTSPQLTGVVADQVGGVWIGVQGIHGLLTTTAQGSALVHYVQLPANVGDVWSGQPEKSGSILWITGFSVTTPGLLESSLLRLDPVTGKYSIIDQPAQTIAPDPNGGFYVTVGEQVTHMDGLGANRQATVKALSDAIAVDNRAGQLWFQDQIKPAFDRLDTSTGAVDQFVYPAVQFIPHSLGSGQSSTSVLVRPHISSMVVDDSGNLWFSVRGGSQIGEVVTSR